LSAIASTPRTSRAAADAIEPRRPTLQKIVFGFIKSQRTFGATDEEMEAGTGLKHQTASPRRRELALMGAVYDSGRKRKTSSGCAATVWRANRGKLRDVPVQGFRVRKKIVWQGAEP